PIHIAARYPTPALLHVLLNRGADPNLPDGVAKTPLHHAILSSQSTNITTLLDAGADPARPDSDARTPLHHAAKLPSPCVRALLHAHLDLDVPDALGNTPLHLAAWANNVPVLELLLQAGAKPTPRNKAGYMPVDLAGSGGHRE
ncbi:ankyrin repeat protein, partial [Patellaria atrata CBS 101060]